MPAIRADRRGFTVAELLIVVAIIAVLVGVAIPVFNNQAERAREATDLANVRSAYAEVMNTAIVEDKASSLYNTESQTFEKKVSLKQAVRGWSMDAKQLVVGGIASGSSGWRGVPSANGTATVSYSLSTRQATIRWGGEDHINKVSAGDFLIKDTLQSVLGGDYSHTVVNSNESYAQGEGTQKITDFFNAKGIDLEDYGAVTWQMYVKDPSGGFLNDPAIYWSTVELEKDMVDKKETYVPVMGYRDGKYDVYRAKVVLYNKDLTNQDGSDKEYLSLANNFANVANEGSKATFQFENYEDAKAAYDKLLASYNTHKTVRPQDISSNKL